MNTLEIKAAFPDVSGKRVANVIEFKEQQVMAQRSDSVKTDTYSSATANDAVAAKVLSFSIGKRFDESMAAKNTDAPSKSNRLQVIDGTSIFNIDRVVENVLGFVNSALTELSKNGASNDDLSYFKQQAIDGVNFGVDQAKEELAELSDDKLIKNIEDSRTRILDGINNLPSNAVDYLSKSSTTANESMSQFSIRTKAGQAIDISFGTKAFLSESTNQSQTLFTTQASNLSFSVAGDLQNSEVNAFADVVNRSDDLANTFYRKNIEGLYNKAISLGYNDKDLMSLSTNDKKSMAYAYEDIKHLNESANREDLSSPKAVAKYVARLLNVMDASERELASEQDYNQIINGLVNQMKDVQVPDLLQAINRFHAFNSKFVNVD